MATSHHVSSVSSSVSTSRDSRRFLPIHAKERSTPQRLGNTWNAFPPSPWASNHSGMYRFSWRHYGYTTSNTRSSS